MAAFIRQAHSEGQTRDQVVEQVMKVYGKKNKQYVQTYYYQIVSGKRPQWQKRQAQRRSIAAAPAGSTVDSMIAKIDAGPPKRKYTKQQTSLLATPAYACNFCPNCGVSLIGVGVAMTIKKEDL